MIRRGVRGRAIVTGMIATYPVGGVVWDYLQYALALERMGFEVFYLEDCGMSSFDPRTNDYTEDFSYGVQFLQQSLDWLSPMLASRWHVRDSAGRTHGVEAAASARAVADADLFLNISGGCLLREEYMSCSRKLLVDTDPGWNHFVNYPKWDASPGWQGTNGYRAHDAFFTYAERLGHAGCFLPTLGLTWHPTRAPVLADAWASEPPGTHWTTVMTWNNFRRPIVHEGLTFGTKELEFPKIEAIPIRTPGSFQVAVGGSDAPRDHWTSLGWSVVDSVDVSRTPRDYRRYVQQSRGELSVAKNVYVATKSGWFSCRSVCYLAAGRPVVLQDTGFSEILPVGEGLLAFTSEEEAVQAIERVERDYERHAAAAREIAREHFDAERVMSKMLATVGLD